MSKADDKGYIRGAKGISGNKDNNFVQSQVNSKAVSNMYGRGWANGSVSQSGGLGDITGESK